MVAKINLMLKKVLCVYRGTVLRKLNDNNDLQILWAGNSQKLVSKMKVVPDYFQKCNKFLAIPRLLYVSMELPGSGCTFKM